MTWSIHTADTLRLEKGRRVRDPLDPLDGLRKRYAPFEAHCERPESVKGFQAVVMKRGGRRSEAVAIWDDRVERLVWAGDGWVERA